ncbi:MAG: MFS transporter [Parcubacteria group bacterium]|jgi:MFS family permease
MTDLTKVKASMILASARFWVIIVVLYLTTKNLSQEQIYQSIGFYYLASMIFEYPTGVIGDYFSHKISVIWGYLIIALAMILFVVSTTFLNITLVYVIYAIGAALISGSDTALLHAVSKNFKNDMSQVRIYSTLISAGALGVGGWLGSIDLRYPFYFNVVFFLGAIIFLLSVKSKNQEKTTGNIFALAKHGISYTFSVKELLHIVLVSSLISSFYLNIKWFYNPLFLALDINLKFWGVLGGISILSIMMGTYIYKKVPEKSIYLYMFLFIGSLILMGCTNLLWVSMVGFFVVNFIRGFLETKIEVDINRAIKSEVRASVLSFRSFLTRFGTYIIVLISGYFLQRYSFQMLMFILAGIIFVVSFYSLIVIRKFELIRVHDLK